MERSSDQAFSGFLFSLWRKGTARELPWENKPCDQVTGTKALGLGLGFCPKLWIFLLLNGSLDIYWAQVAIGEQRRSKEEAVGWSDSPVSQVERALQVGCRKCERAQQGKSRHWTRNREERGESCSCYHLRKERVLWGPFSSPWLSPASLSSSLFCAV